MTQDDPAAGGVNRRSLLQATGAVGALAVAGCVSGQGKEAGDQPADQQAATDQTEPKSDLPSTSSPETVNVDEQGGEVTLRTVPSRHPAHPGEAMGGPVELPEVWAFQADDGEPSVPGPVLRTTEGNDMEVTLDNSHSNMPHTLHFHGARKTWENDGVPTTTGITVGPGEKHTYEIPANVPGTHFYHCHFQTHRHVEMGMYGIFRVDPKGYEPADREYFMTLRDWDSRLSRQMAGEDVQFSMRNRKPDVFTINGKAAPRTLHPEEGTPILVSEGDTVRLHFVNAGYMSHPMHTHNHRFQLVEKDGGEIPAVARHHEDITNIAPAERHVVEFEADADPGIYPLHCHKVDHVMNGSVYPGGMLSAIVYEQAMDSDIFLDLMDAAGYDA
jgi:FtsP/CotA-like multicopper oxidase with cupredoxin domain